MAEQSISGAAMLHTLQRHRDILNELTREYHKTNSLYETRKEREELLRGGSSNNAASGSFGRQNSSNADGVNNRRDLFLKENQHLHKYVNLIILFFRDINYIIDSFVLQFRQTNK